MVTKEFNRDIHNSAKAKNEEDPYRPQKDTRVLLDLCWKLVQSVDYKITRRWLFYQLVQKHGYSKSVRSLGNISDKLSNTRKRYYKQWTPETLADDTRVHITSPGWLNTIPDTWNRCKNVQFHSDRLIGQEYYPIVWIEARAMIGQFRKYVLPYGVPIFPLGGSTSIPFKYKILQTMLYAKQEYNAKPIILHFGDCDKKGFGIPEEVLRSLRMWVENPDEIRYERVGLDLDQAKAFNLPFNPERPDQYQWEALSDEQARGLIVPVLEKYLDIDLINKNIEKDREYTTMLQSAIRKIAPTFWKEVER